MILRRIWFVVKQCLDPLVQAFVWGLVLVCLPFGLVVEGLYVWALASLVSGVALLLVAFWIGFNRDC